MEEKKVESAGQDGNTGDETAGLVGIDGENTTHILCKFCQSKVLRPGAGRFIKNEYSLPTCDSKVDKNSLGTDTELLVNFWHVKDILHFENVGFSKKVGNVQYLVCADCESGPIGWHDKTDRTKSFVALSRVQHK